MIDELEKDDEVEGRLLLQGIDKHRTKSSDEPFLVLYFRDSTGDIEGRMWETEDIEPAPGEVVYVQGEVVEYKNSPQIKVKDIRTDNEAEVSDFVPNKTPYEVDNLYAKTLQRVDQYCSPQVKKCVGHFMGYDFEKGRVSNENRKNIICSYPAARSHHHDHTGGLIEHIHSMTELACLTGKHYNDLYRDVCGEEPIDIGLLVAGTVLHDLGKTVEYSDPVSPQYTTRGERQGHIVVMNDALLRYYTNSDMPMEDYRHIKHLILSHHGQKEWGSPAEPDTIEAQLLHRIDMMDSRMAPEITDKYFGDSEE